jgi:hypothetical protein
MPRRMAHEILLNRVHDAVGLSPDETPVVEVMPFDKILRLTKILTC